MFGVKVLPEHIAAAENLIPKLPGLVNQAVTSINGAMANFDRRLKELESRDEQNRFLLAEILQEVHLGRYDDSDTRPAGTGATQRVIESGGNLNGEPGGLVR